MIRILITDDHAIMLEHLKRILDGIKYDYVLALKGNHDQLHEQVVDFFEMDKRNNYKNLDQKLGKLCKKRA